MVAISLYRGNLHRVENPDRHWLLPPRKISLKDFKVLLQKRSRALSRIVTPSSNPNPQISPKEHEDSVHICNHAKSDTSRIQKEGDEENRPVRFQDNIGTGKRKRDIEEKLQHLNSKKHNLVQALKHILNTEEVLMKRNSLHGGPLLVPLQLDTANGSPLVDRQLAASSGLERNTHGENLEEAEHLRHKSSMSPSTESPLWRSFPIQYNGIPHPARGYFGSIGNPSPFTPSASNLTISASGASYIVSSPSPMASGGTSTFRDARQTSPWS